MGRWIAGAIRAEVGADVAIVNQSGLRQSLPRGPITKASIWSIMPFDNRVMLVTLDGAALLRDLVNKEAVLSGALRTASGFALDGGRPLDPSAVYRAATLDFLFFGGDSFAFEKHARGSEERADWREIVIAWTKKQRTAKDRPLEACLPR
jgi:2',3'-cyclic-nucleotide 2'-phosphodiesterase (5'-nucleotidase family)